jgi:hypothetical protein
VISRLAVVTQSTPSNLAIADSAARWANVGTDMDHHQQPQRALDIPQFGTICLLNLLVISRLGLLNDLMQALQAEYPTDKQ